MIDMSDATTKEKLLDNAERLFAEEGFTGVSLRAIIKAAGVNTAAVHYHFGSKEALVQAVLDRRAEPINRGRLARLDELESGGGGLRVESIVEAFFAPALEALRPPARHQWLPRLIGRAITETDASVRDAMQAVFLEVFQRFHAAFSRALPQLTPEEVATRMHFMIGAMAFTFAFPQMHEDTKGGRGARDPDALMRDLISYVAAGFRAPVSEKAGEKAQ
jgi:AcrR family transcriptional regulator